MQGAGRKNIVADWGGGTITSDTGMLLLREFERKLRLFDRIDELIDGPRDPRWIVHRQRTILDLSTKRLREQWPDVKIVFCGGSGFCRWRMLRWRDNNGVRYIVGLAKNRRLTALGQLATAPPYKSHPSI